MWEPERSLEPPDIPDVEVPCPVCQTPARTFYLDAMYEVFGCEYCVKSNLIDDLLDIPETMPIPKCKGCGEREQSVYADKFGTIRACIKCVKKRPSNSQEF